MSDPMVRRIRKWHDQQHRRHSYGTGQSEMPLNAIAGLPEYELRYVPVADAASTTLRNLEEATQNGQALRPARGRSLTRMPPTYTPTTVSMMDGDVSPPSTSPTRIPPMTDPPSINVEKGDSST